MGEIRNHPECENILGLGITRAIQAAPYHPNWVPAWTVSGPKLAPPIAFEIARKFQNEFNLLWSRVLAVFDDALGLCAANFAMIGLFRKVREWHRPFTLQHHWF